MDNSYVLQTTSRNDVSPCRKNIKTVFAFIFMLLSYSVQGKVWYVNDTNILGDIYTNTIGSNSNIGTAVAPFATITYAIAQALPNDTILVDAGTYTELVIIPNTKSNISLMGANAGIGIGINEGTRNSESIISGRVTIGTGIALNGFTINGFTINCADCTTASDQRAIYITATGTISITNNIITGNTNTRAGILNANVGSPYFVITNNKIIITGTASTVIGGIALGGSGTTSYISGNIIQGPGNSRVGIQLYSSLLNAQHIYNNQIGDLNVAIVSGNSAGNIIQNNILGKSSFGVYLASSNNTIRHNFIQNNNYGVYQEPGAGLVNNIVQNNSFTINALYNILNGSSNAFNVILATCNWYGSTIITNITSKISGSILYEPFLTNGTDNNLSTYGFQPLSNVCIGCLNGLLVSNITSGQNYCAIQSGINDTNTLNGDTLLIGGGIYIENVDASIKSITLGINNSPDCFTVNGNFTLASSNVFSININGNTACSEFDQLTVSGLITLGGASLNIGFNYLPLASEEIILINNTGVNSIVGQFAQGNSIFIVDKEYAIHYDGGDGNDLTLTLICPILSPTITPNGSTEICQGGGITLDAGSNYSTYTWNETGNNATSQTIFANSAGLYVVTVSDTYACTAEASINVTLVNASIATIAGNTSLCAGGVMSLIATGGNQYQWSGPNGYSATSGSITRLNTNPTMSGTYTVTVTNNNCIVVLNISVTVHPIPSATLSGASSICSGGTITLTAPAGAASYQWSGPGGFSTNTGSANTLTRTNATTTMAGQYKVTVTNTGGCTATASRSVSVSAPTTAAVTGATSVCGNANVILTATTVGVAYEWTGPGGFSAYTASINTPAVAGQYKVTVTNATGCISTATRNITVTAAPNATITGNTTVCVGGTIYLMASGGNSYTWTGPNGYTKTGSSVVRSGATANMFGTYTVTVTGSGGCTSSASITVSPCSSKTITDEAALSLSVYPNPTNNTTIITLTLPNEEAVTLSVYNLEGKEVAVLFNGMTEANKTYQLVFNTQDLPAGTYYAVLRKAEGSQQSMPVLVVK